MPFDGFLLLTISGGLLLLLWFVYVGGPLLIYFTHTQAARPNLIPFFPGQVRLPPDVDRFFSDVCAGLCAERFELLSGMFLPNQTENVFAALLFLVNRRDRATAIVVAIHGKAPVSTPVTHRAVEFNTGFRDRHVVQTHNSPVPTAFPRSDSITNTLLPSVKDPRLLYRVHCEQVRLRGGEVALRLDEEFRGDAIAYLQSDMIEELERAVGCHYLWLDARAGIYRPTLKGAFLMTWREMWPIKAIRLVQQARRERQLLTELTYRLPELARIGA